MSPTLLLLVSKLGYAILTELADYRTQHKGGLGCIGMKTATRNGDVADTAVVVDGKKTVIVTTKKGTVILFPLGELKVTNRNCAGVKVVSLLGDDEVQTITVA